MKNNTKIYNSQHRKPEMIIREKVPGGITG